MFKVVACDCQDILQTLVVNGLFPASPSQPCLTLSIELLDLYRALFECSCDAVNALASTLHSHYVHRGFHYHNSKVGDSSSLCGIYHTYHVQGEVVKDPFHRGIGHAIQWYDNLQGQLNDIVNQALKAADETIAAIKLTRFEPSAIPKSSCLSPSSDIQPQPSPPTESPMPFLLSPISALTNLPIELPIPFFWSPIGGHSSSCSTETSYGMRPTTSTTLPCLLRRSQFWMCRPCVSLLLCLQAGM